ncbi:MAG TPA: hypothetical protein VKV29_04750 [Chthonomonas sp.]|jgi:hypothetical protein|nr:hypothetical protein [Chthonomonas sp.]
MRQSFAQIVIPTSSGGWASALRESAARSTVGLEGEGAGRERSTVGLEELVR